MPTAELLADFQGALLELLDQDCPVDEIQRRLREEAAFAAFREYVECFEPRMIAVAMELVRKWGRRRNAEPTRLES